MKNYMKYNMATFFAFVSIMIGSALYNFAFAQEDAANRQGSSVNTGVDPASNIQKEKSGNLVPGKFRNYEDNCADALNRSVLDGEIPSKEPCIKSNSKKPYENNRQNHTPKIGSGVEGG